MNQGKYVFSQIMEQVVRYKFNKCVAKYRGEYWVKNFSCWEQFLAMAFGQLAMRNSLRDVVVCLNAQADKLYHLGFKSLNHPADPCQSQRETGLENLSGLRGNFNYRNQETLL